MYKFLAVLGILVLVGAGCSNEPTKPTSREMAPAPQEGSAVENDATSDSESLGGGVQGKVTIKSEGSTSDIDAGGGATLTVETPPEEEGITEVPLDEPVAQTINMESNNFSFSPKTITANAGDRIKIVFTKNSGFHTIVIDEINLKATIAQGEGITFRVPSKPGSYPFYCDVGSHRAMGMEGTLIVK